MNELTELLKPICPLTALELSELCVAIICMKSAINVRMSCDLFALLLARLAPRHDTVGTFQFANLKV